LLLLAVAAVVTALAVVVVQAGFLLRLAYLSLLGLRLR
jgi:hypothetical protein